MSFPTNPPGPLSAGSFHFPESRSSVLENGMTIVVVNDTALPRVGIKLAITSGLTLGEYEKPGITAVTASMLSKGAGKRSADEIADEEGYLGTEIITTGGKDYSIISASVLSEFVGEAVTLIADIIINPTFPEDELAKVLGYELASLQNKRTQPSYQARKVYSKVLYGDHPYGAFDTDEAILQSLNRDALRDFHSRHLHPQLAYVVMSGDISFEKAMILAEEHFGDWAATAKTDMFEPELKMETRRRLCIVDNPNAVQSNIYIGNPAIPLNHPDYIRLLVTNQVLGGGFASRLFMNLREEKSFTYGAYSKLDTRVKGGTLLAYAAVRNEVTVDAIDEFLLEFNRIRNEKVGEDEMKAAKDYLTGSFPLGLERSIDVADHIVLQKIHGFPEDYWDTFREQVDAVSPAQVIETANKYICPEDAMICVVGKAGELSPILSKYGEPEIFDKTGNPISSN